jgi:hypothetical protein
MMNTAYAPGNRRRIVKIPITSGAHSGNRAQSSLREQKLKVRSDQEDSNG